MHACGFQNFGDIIYLVSIICPPLVLIGLRLPPKLGVDQSLCPYAHRRVCIHFMIQIRTYPHLLNSWLKNLSSVDRNVHCC